MRASIEIEGGMGDFRGLLASQYDWLVRRVRLQASAWGLADAHEDLLQETLMIALDRLPRFFEGPSRNEVARMRHLLVQSLRSAATNLFRQRAKTPLAGADALPERATVEDPESLVAAEQHRREHLGDARSRLSPAVALVYLGMHFPHEVREEDLRKAADFRGGGAQGLARPVSEAWSLFRRIRDDHLPRVSESAWKRLLVEVLFSSAPIGEASPEDMDRGIRNVDTRLARARARLGLERPSSQGQTK